MAKVMIIDREPRMQQALCQLFSNQGYRTAGVSNGVEAAKIMRREVPDLILLDHDVPMGGIKTAQIIRMHPSYGTIPILLGVQVQNRSQLNAILAQSRKACVTGMLLRPYAAARLLEKARECLGPDEGDGKAGDKGGEKAKTGDEAALEIRTQIRELTDLPTISVAQQRIISIMSQDDTEVDVDELVSAVQSDQALTMRIMRIAKSAYYGFTGNFIRSAVTFLGMSRVRQIVQSATVLEIFDKQGKQDGGGLDRKGAWKHSVACGMVMQKLARDNRHARHFTVGLLHDVGKLVLDYRFGEYSRAIAEIATEEKRPMYLVEKEMIGLSHAEIGYEVANLWQLPNELAESIVHHHEPSRAYRHKYLSSLVYLADVAVRQMEIGVSGNMAPASVEDSYAKKLHAPLEHIVSQRDDIARQVEAIVTPE
jgi:putative nucleotidyltransferase with HDIG domain